LGVECFFEQVRTLDDEAPLLFSYAPAPQEPA
jgi:hypothetical protein